MSNILSLALKINTDASGLKLDPVERALKRLGEETEKVSGIFDKFTATSGAAAKAQADTEKALNDLIAARKAGTISGDEFVESFRAVEKAATEQASAFQRGIDITQKYVTAEERRSASIAELDSLLKAGAVSQETYARAVADASGANAEAAEAERSRAQALAEAEAQRKAVLAEGVQLAQRFATEEEKRAATLQRIQELLNQGAISEEIALRARAEASGANAAAAKAEKERADALASASRIIQANLTPQERYDNQIQELQGHLDAGRLSQEQFNRAASNARQDLDRVGQSAEKTDKNIESLAKRLGLLTAIEVGRVIVDGIQAIGNVISSTFSQVSSFVTSVANSFDRFNDLSARTGIGVEALQGYSLAAQLAGVETEAFGAAVQRLGVSIGKATPGDALDKSLKAINLSVTELRGLSPESQFSEIGEAISALPTAADRAAAAVAVFGQQGAALAPLFREGAESIEDLRARADRLGIIVDEAQLNNIGAMNDAFDLARKTVEGIAGQVIGNLAPAVTAVVDQFLQFIEAFEGADGAGGSAIADKISRVLLDAADYFAVKFDQLAEYFSGFSVTLEGAGTVFATVADILTVVVESFRTVFNLLQVGVGAITEGLGRVLEGIGSWVSSDLEAFGSGLANAAAEQNRLNIAEMEDAAGKAADAFNRALDGSSGSTASAGQGAASRFMQGVRSQFEQEQSPEFRVESNIDDTAERLTRFLADAGDGADKFFVQSSETLKVFEQQAVAGELTADQIAIMNGFMENLNGQLDVELAKRREVADAATQQAEADAKRVAELTKTSDAASKVIDDLAAIEREITRAQAAASNAGADAGAIGSARDRLAELENLRDSLNENLEAASLGFEKGFGEAFSKVGADIEQLGVKAAEFGTAGSEAFIKLQEGIQAAKDQVGDGILNRAAFEAQVQQQRELFDQELVNIKEAADERRRVNEFVDKTLLAIQFGGDQQRGEAAQRALDIEQEIIRVQQEVEQARALGNGEAVQAGITRLGQLDQVAAKERDIASGRAKLEEEVAKKRDEALKKQQQAIAKQAEEQRKAAEKQAEAQRKAFEEQAKKAQAEFNRRAEIQRQLNSVGQQSIGGGDIRSSQGAQAFLRTAANAFDPRAAEQLRLQREQLKLMRALAERLVPEALGYLQQGLTTTVSFLGNTP